MAGGEYAIEVKNVKKSFRVYYDKGKTLKEKALHAGRNKYEKREVLKGISFQVGMGEAVGLIGKNGCGKSTTLKLLTRIIYPDAGTVQLKGRVSSLLELGAGFHPDMSGRENVYINAAIFGLKKKEIDRRMDEIIAFSELGAFMDCPVRTYSSGMYMRLAFSVAIHVDADILLIDEILAVGDVNFQSKCFRKLLQIKESGTTIVLVSHSMEQVERICERSIWIHEGAVRMDGIPRDVHREYLNFMGGERRKQAGDKNQNERATGDIQGRRGTGEARIRKVRLYGTKKESRFFMTGDTLRFILEYEVYETVNQAVFGLCVIRNDGVRCYGTNTRAENLAAKCIKKDGTVSMTFQNCLLLSGVYDVDVTIENAAGETIDYYDKAVSFEVDSHRRCTGVAWMEHVCDLGESQGSDCECKSQNFNGKAGS